MTTPLKIQPRPPIRGGLVSVSAPLPTDDWHHGVELCESPDDGLFTWQTCASEGQSIDCDTFGEDILDEKPVSDVGGCHRFFPQIVGKIVQCGPGATQTTIGDMALDTARGSLDRMVGKALAGTMHGALQTVENAEVGASFANLATYPPGFSLATPGSVRGVLHGLLDQVCCCFNSDPVFHVPRAFLPYFLADNLVVWDEASETFRFGPYLVSFDCYPNEAPNPDDELANPTLTDGTEVWIYTTTQPLVAFAEVDEVTVLTRELNRYRAMVERAMIVAFDPTCVGAAKARVCP